MVSRYTHGACWTLWLGNSWVKFKKPQNGAIERLSDNHHTSYIKMVIADSY